MARAILPSLLLVSVALFYAAKALPQGETTSAIAGQVIDATSAAIPGALVTSQIARRAYSAVPRPTSRDASIFCS
jgi:hypothetical protein